MPKNDLLRKLNAAFDAGMEAGERVSNQYMADCLMIVLHRIYGFGARRQKRMIQELQRIHDYYYKVFRVTKDNPECDVLRAEFDAVLMDCLGEEGFCEFPERYPDIKGIRY